MHAIWRPTHDFAALSDELFHALVVCLLIDEAAAQIVLSNSKLGRDSRETRPLFAEILTISFGKTCGAMHDLQRRAQDQFRHIAIRTFGKPVNALTCYKSVPNESNS